MINEFVRMLRSQIDAEITASRETISGGRAENFAEYKFLAGRIQGLRLVSELLTDLAKKVTDDDD